MRKLIIALIVLAGLLVAADRAAVAVAEHEIAVRAQTQASLGSPPDVSIRGIPFLTQAISGTYDDVTVTVDNLDRSGLRVLQVKAHFHGVHVPLSDAINGSVSHVPVDRIDAQAFLSYHDINAYLDRTRSTAVTVSAGPNGQVHVTGTVAGVSASGDGSISASAQGLTINAGQGLVVQLPLTKLPFELRTASARGTPSGIAASATADNVDLVP